MVNKNIRPTHTVGAPRVTRLDQLVSLLSTPEGTTICDLVAATGWQAHSVRGALAGALKKRGHHIVSEKIYEARRYRIVTA